MASAQVPALCGYVADRNSDLTPSKVETIVWLCTASSILVADVVLQIQEYLRSRPAAAKLPLVSQAMKTARI
jgi:hypothetical protein